MSLGLLVWLWSNHVTIVTYKQCIFFYCTTLGPVFFLRIIHLSTKLKMYLSFLVLKVHSRTLRMKKATKNCLSFTIVTWFDHNQAKTTRDMRFGKQKKIVRWTRFRLGWKKAKNYKFHLFVSIVTWFDHNQTQKTGTWNVV